MLSKTNILNLNRYLEKHWKLAQADTFAKLAKLATEINSILKRFFFKEKYSSLHNKITDIGNKNDHSK